MKLSSPVVILLQRPITKERVTGSKLGDPITKGTKGQLDEAGTFQHLLLCMVGRHHRQPEQYTKEQMCLHMAYHSGSTKCSIIGS